MTRNESRWEAAEELRLQLERTGLRCEQAVQAIYDAMGDLANDCAHIYMSHVPLENFSKDVYDAILNAGAE